MPGLDVTKVTPDFWIKSTSLTFKRRSPDTLELDGAYKAFYTSSGTREAAFLLRVLHKYVTNKGRDWSKVERNKASKGYMQRLYNELKEALKTDPLVADIVDPESAKKQVVAAYDRLNREDIPHSRLGVFYLLGNLKVDVDIVGTVISGITTAGVAASLGGVAEFSSASHPAPSVTGMHATTMGVGSVGGHAVQSGTVIGAGRGVGNVARGFVAGTGTATNVGYDSRAAALPDYKKFSDFERAPVSPSYAMSRAQRPGENDTVYAMKNFARNVVWDMDNLLTAEAGLASARLEHLASDISVGSERFWIMLKDALKGVVRKVSVVWNLKPHELAAMSGSAVKAALTAALNYIVGAAVPFVGAGMQIGRGLLRTIDAAVDKIRAYLDRKEITIMSGHPELVAGSIERRMSWAIGEGLLETVKGGVNMTAQVMLPGLGALATAIVAALEWLTRTIMRIVEDTKLSAWLVKVNALWQDIAAQHPIEELVNEAGRGRTVDPERRSPFIYDKAIFSELFQEGCDISPMVPMLVLNSGVCGSLMTMIRTVTDDTEVISQREFDAGTRYMDRLKTFSAGYLRRSGFKLTPRNPADRFYQQLLGHAVHDHEQLATRGTKLWAALKA